MVTIWHLLPFSSCIINKRQHTEREGEKTKAKPAKWTQKDTLLSGLNVSNKFFIEFTVRRCVCAFVCACDLLVMYALLFLFLLLLLYLLNVILLLLNSIINKSCSVHLCIEWPCFPFVPFEEHKNHINIHSSAKMDKLVNEHTSARDIFSFTFPLFVFSFSSFYHLYWHRWHPIFCWTLFAFVLSFNMKSLCFFF